MQVQRDHRDRLTQAHVVGEAAAESQLGHPREPPQPA
jgi:hypothetical protein